MCKIACLSSLFILTVVLEMGLLFSVEDFTVWGPGLKPNVIVMPARYFFIETDKNCEEVMLSIKIEGVTNKNRACRIRTDIMQTADCSHIVRYKLYDACETLTINIKYGENHVARSPYNFTKVYPDTCACPMKDLDEFLLEWQCGDVPQQIVSDLSIFENIDFDILRQKIITKYNQPNAISLCHYVIQSNKIYTKCYGKYVGFSMFMEGILLSLSRRISLPDMEFFVNLGDWPLVKDFIDNIPIFSWCGSHDSYDIVMPTYDITEASLEMLGRIMLDMLSVQGNAKEKWKNRIPKVFWRGRDSSRERLNLIDISHEHTDLFNVSLTNFFFFRSEEEKYGPKSPHVSFFSFFDYKYQLNLDGTVAAYRLPYLLGGGSLVLKQESKYYEHFYNDLLEDVHYVLVKRDLSDLVEKVEWAVDNDEKAHLIAKTGQDFAKKNLLPQDIFCYHAFLFKEYSKKIVSKIRVLNDMKVVVDAKHTDCDCEQKMKDEL